MTNPRITPMHEHGPGEDYTIIFAELDDAGNLEILTQAREVDDQIEAIDLLREATEGLDRPEVFTYMSA